MGRFFVAQPQAQLFSLLLARSRIASFAFGSKKTGTFRSFLLERSLSPLGLTKNANSKMLSLRLCYNNSHE